MIVSKNQLDTREDPAMVHGAWAYGNRSQKPKGIGNDCIWRLARGEVHAGRSVRLNELFYVTINSTWVSIFLRSIVLD